MRNAKLAALLVVCAIALPAQDTIFNAGPLGGPPMGAMGAKTFAFISGELVGGNPVKGAPYSGSAVTETTQTLADGNRIVNRHTALVYRDGEGRERREQALPNIGPFAAQGAPATTIFISDPVGGANYSLNSAEKTAIKLPLPPAGAPPRVAGARGAADIMVQRTVTVGPGPGMPPAFPMAQPQIMIYKSSGTGAPDAPAVDQLGTKVVEGVQAEGTRTRLTIPAGQIGNDMPVQIMDEVWRSPELQVIVHSEHSDPRFGKTVYSLTDISRNDPLPSLFQVPADYTVTDPPAMPFQKAVPLPQ